MLLLQGMGYRALTAVADSSFSREQSQYLISPDLAGASLSRPNENASAIELALRSLFPRTSSTVPLRKFTKCLPLNFNFTYEASGVFLTRQSVSFVLLIFLLSRHSYSLVFVNLRYACKYFAASPVTLNSLLSITFIVLLCDVFLLSTSVLSSHVCVVARPNGANFFSINHILRLLSCQSHHGCPFSPSVFAESPEFQLSSFDQLF